MRALWLTEANEGADGAELVRRVAFPLRAHRPRMRLGEIAIEGRCDGTRGKLAELPARRDGNCCGCWIVIAELHRSWDVVDFVRCHCAIDRCE